MNGTRERRILSATRRPAGAHELGRGACDATSRRVGATAFPKLRQSGHLDGAGTSAGRVAAGGAFHAPAIERRDAGGRSPGAPGTDLGTCGGRCRARRPVHGSEQLPTQRPTAAFPRASWPSGSQRHTAGSERRGSPAPRRQNPPAQRCLRRRRRTRFPTGHVVGTRAQLLGEAASR